MKVREGWENDKGLTVNKEGEIEGNSGNLRFLNQVMERVFFEQ